MGNIDPYNNESLSSRELVSLIWLSLVIMLMIYRKLIVKLVEVSRGSWWKKVVNSGSLDDQHDDPGL